MAVSGGATTVYLLQRHGQTFTMTRGTALRSLCDDPQTALDLFMTGRQVRISSDQMETFRRQCEQALQATGMVR